MTGWGKIKGKYFPHVQPTFSLIMMGSLPRCPCTSFPWKVTIYDRQRRFTTPLPLVPWLPLDISIWLRVSQWLDKQEIILLNASLHFHLILSPCPEG